MASRGNSALGDDNSEAQASGCRREEMVRSSGLNTQAAPYVPACMQSPRAPMPAAAINGYNTNTYMQQPVYDSPSFHQNVYSHDQSELSSNAGNGVYSSYLPIDHPSHLPVAYPGAGQPMFYHQGAVMPSMYLTPRHDMYGQLHHEGGAREEGHPGSLNSTTPVCNTTSTSSSGTSHPPPSWTSATSATAAALPLLSTPPVSANSDSSFPHMPRYFDHPMSKMPYSVQASGSATQNKRPPDRHLFRAANPPPSNSMITVKNCHVSLSLINNQPGSYTGETQHHPPNPAASLAHPQINTSFAPPYMCSMPIPFGMFGHAMDINMHNQGMQVRHQQPKSRASADARVSVARGRSHPAQRGGPDVRRSRHGETDRSSIGSNVNRNSINEDGCDFADTDYSMQSNNEVDLHSSRSATLESNSGIPHHLEGTPLVINPASHRYTNYIPYSPVRVMSVSQGVPLRMNAPQAGESARDSGCSSPCDVSPIVVSTPISMPVSSPNLETINSTAHNGLAVDQSSDGSHVAQSIAVNYEPDGTYSNNTLTNVNNSAPYVTEAYGVPALDHAYASSPSNSSNGASTYPVTAAESTGAVSMTEAAPMYNGAPVCQNTYDHSSNFVSSENQGNQSVRALSSEVPPPETPAVYTATVTAHHLSTRSSLEATDAISNVDTVEDREVAASELEKTHLSASRGTRSVSPSCLEQSPESPESELGDLKPIFETREEHNLSFTMTFGDLTRETIIQELEKNKTCLPTPKSRVEDDASSQNISLSITSSNPVFDTSISSPSTNTPSIGFGTMPENEDVVTSRPAVRRKETVFSETRENVDTSSKSPSSLIDDVSCSVTIPSTGGLSTGEVATDSASPVCAASSSSISYGGPTVTENVTLPTTASADLSCCVTAEKPPLPSAAKKQFAISNTTVRSVPAQAEPSAPSAWGKNKNWKEEFKGNSGEYRQKSTAIISPMIRNGVMEDDDFTLANANGGMPTTDAAVTSPATGARATTAMPPPPVDGTALKMDKIKVGGFLFEYKTNSNSVTLQPRGLTNKNYWCYANTVLQALTAVPQFVNLYTAMQQQVGSAITPHTMPISYSIISYLKEFSIMNASAINLDTRTRKKTGQNIVNLPEVQLGDPFEPSSIQNMLLDKPGGQFMEGCQQDAEEMLSFLLNASHDEFNECLKLAALEKEKSSGRKAPSAVVLPNGQTDESNDDWVTMGPKNKTCITRTTEFSHSPISEIFWGESRVIIKKGNSPVTNNLEPFITLPLDIQDENVKSVKEALHQFVSKADVAGYTCTDTQEELTVSSQRLLEQLPQVLILQLKRFVYLKDGGLQKVIKDISLSVDLEINKELISQQRRKKLSGEKVKYKLVSVIYHDGKDANKGHYVCNIYHPGYHCWLHYDDACVKPIVSTELQRCYAPRVPYLLFYRRADTFAEDTAPCAIQPLPNRRRTKDRRNPSADKISCERRADAETRPSNDGPSAPECHSRVSSVDRKPTSTERKASEKNSNANLQKGNNKRQDRKQTKNKQVAKN